MLPELKDLLSGREKRILFAGVGNILRSDDGTGVYISKNIINTAHVSSLTVEMSIENYIGKINSINPDILIMIDCVDMNSKPGTCKLLAPGIIRDMTFNTHNIALTRISEFFKMPVYILGIQPKDIDFGENLSYIVIQVADKIIQLINH